MAGTTSSIEISSLDTAQRNTLISSPEWPKEHCNQPTVPLLLERRLVLGQGAESRQVGAMCLVCNEGWLSGTGIKWVMGESTCGPLDSGPGCMDG